MRAEAPDGAPAARRVVGLWLEVRIIPVALWSVSAILLGAALAWEDRTGSGWWTAAAVGIGVLLQGVVAHAVNEIADWRSGTDRHPAPRTLSGGSKTIRAGLLGERELAVAGVAAAAAAAGLGLWVASQRGWWLLALGVVGLGGAVLYTLPPIAAAYTPVAGEAVAFACVVACVIGGYGVLAGPPPGRVFLVGAAHGAYCVAMLMVHHYLDRIPDRAAHPPKRTSVAVLGPARGYATAWAAAAAGAWIAATIVVDWRLVPAAACACAVVPLHASVDIEAPASVTRVEAVVIAAGLAGALVAAIAIAPPLAWALVVLLPALGLELVLQGRVLGPRLAPRGT